jgi:chitinase
MTLLKRFCCPDAYKRKWKSCQWYGEPGSCFDNHCPSGHHVQLTDSPYGGGESCFPRLERNRVFCCEPATGHSQFLPVPLDRLFPSPPTGSNVNVQFDLKIQKDKDRGGLSKSNPGDNPNHSAFAFYVMASPTEIQTTLRADQGSHWEVFNCTDTTSEELQTVQMVCTDTSKESNCAAISLGHGVPGTILEMPPGCGSSKYAVAHSLVPSMHQVIPHHIKKRNLGFSPVVYDLKFDYEWVRVPQDFGSTQLRVDFSNEEV